ncbi:hypothetical protein JCM21900_006151 [Sporobolomyces salmonicolor]
MRSLVLLDAHFHHLPPTSSPATLAAISVDPASDATYAITQASSGDGADFAGEVTLEIYKLPPRRGAERSQNPQLLTSWTTYSLPSFDDPASSSSAKAPSPSPSSLVVSFKYLPEDDALCVVLSNGDIEQVFLSGGTGDARRENVGTFDAGIKAAEWSPDDELLAIVTGADLLLTLTKTFDPLSESPLHTSTFGTDAPVSVGWGTKATQFHGSLGKSAAAAAASAAADPLNREVLLSAQDDGRTRVRWRGDAAWFAVSSIEEVVPRAEGGAKREIRRVRIFSRLGELSSTSEPVVELESALAWQPSGEVIASTQCVGAGDEVRTQVVFFERNGLRRYEFPVRNEGGEAGRVREVAWNAASDVLAAWIERPVAGGAREVEHVVHLYHRSNYHWYLKQSLRPSLSPSSKLTSLAWHPEKPLELSLIAGEGVETFELCWDTFRSARDPPEDDATVAVVDGANPNLTPFRLLNIPPPMSGLTLDLASLSSLQQHSTPVHIAFAASTSIASPTSSTDTPPLYFALLHPTSHIELFSWRLSLAGNAQSRARAGLPSPELMYSLPLDPQLSAPRAIAKQCAVVTGLDGDVRVGVLRTVRDESGEERDEVCVVDGRGAVERVVVMEGARRIVGKGARTATADEEEEEEEEEEEAGFVLETDEGWVLEVPIFAKSEDLALPSSSLSPFPEFCPQIQHLLLPSCPPSSSRFPTLLGLAPSGRLYASSRLLASDATSFATTPDFLIYTTFSHEAKFVPLFTLVPTYTGSAGVEHTESFARRAAGGGAAAGEGGAIKRAVERGSRIVAVAPSSTSLVLQMPRGNLETICPRPLVLRVVRDFLDTRRYRSAFLLSRRHRIDLNLLYDHDPSAFKAHLAEFVDQVKDVDHLNLFLSGLKDEDVTRGMYRPVLAVGAAGGVGKASEVTNKVNTVCDLVRGDLEKRDVFHYANSILTAYVRKRPPAYEDALKVLADLKAKDAERAEDAVKYIIFLSDANKLFDLALGMYDFALVLMIAQHSQKDPREYLPFLRALRELPLHLQRHKIDDHLARHDSALRNLALAGDEHFDAALEYAKKHGLFATALEAYEDDQVKYRTVLCAHAEDLFDRSKYSEAGLLFSLGGQPAKAMLAYQHANAWPELFTLALTSGKRSPAEVKELATEVGESLASKRRYAEAARVLLEYGRDVEAAVAALCEGNLYSEAVRLTALYSRPDLKETHIKPSTLEHQQRLLDDFADLTEQIERQVERLDELKVKRDENPYQYFCVDDPAVALENVEIAPDGVSDAGTAFTRYTVAPTTLASSQRTSSKTAKSRRRAGLKKMAGKKSSVYEEMYLLNSMKKSVEVKLAELQTETAALLPILLTLSSSTHRTAAAELQSALATLESFLASTVSTVWTWRELEWRAEQHEEQRIRDTGDAALLARWDARAKPVEGEQETKRVERPAVPKGKWRVGMLEAGST